MNEEIRQRTKWFMEDRFGMFIHWGLYSIPACGEWMMSQKEMNNIIFRKRSNNLKCTIVTICLIFYFDKT